MTIPERSERTTSIPSEASHGPDSLAATEAKIKQIESWLEKLEKTIPQTTTTKTQTTTNDDNNDAQNPYASPKPQPIILPLTKKDIETGLHQPITSSLRWLAEWSIRMIKMYHNRVMYPAS